MPQTQAPSRRPVAVDVGIGALAALVSTVVALAKVGGPSALSTLWGHWDFTTFYVGASTLGRQLWLTPNETFGYPFVQDLAHYPTPDVVHIAVLKALAVVAGDPLVAANVFLMLTFAFVAASAYALFRVLRVPAWIAFALAVSYSLIPWHFDRFIHAFLANYSSVPIGLILVVAILSWNLGIAGPDRGRTRDLLIALALAVYVGLAGGYYAVFISLLAVVTLVFQVVVGRRGRNLLPAVWIALIPVVVSQGAAFAYKLLAVTPAPSASVFARAPEESQMYGGAVFTLLRTSHVWSEGLGIPGLQFVQTINSPLESDARNSTVGLIAVVASLVVCAIVLVRNGRGAQPADGVVARLGYWPWLFMVSVLFFATGAFGQAFSVFLLFQIRSWGRFAIVAIAVAYVILGLLLLAWHSRSRRKRVVSILVVGLVLAATALDVATSPEPFDRAVAQREADELRDLGQQVDAALPAGCGVYQLPAYTFPEGVPPDGTPTYDPMLPSLYSLNARWSYGGIRGTQAGDWQSADVARDLPTAIQQATAAGFCAIMLDESGFADVPSPRDDLSAALGAPIASSSTGRWQLFSLADADPGPFTADYVLEPVRVTYGFGFAIPEDGNARVSAEMRGTDAALFVRRPIGDAVSGVVEFEAESVGCVGTTTLLASTAGDQVEATLDGTMPTTVRVPVDVPADDLTAVHLSVAPTCSSTATDNGERVRVVNPRFIPD